MTDEEKIKEFLENKKKCGESVVVPPNIDMGGCYRHESYRNSMRMFYAGSDPKNKIIPNPHRGTVKRKGHRKLPGGSQTYNDHGG